MPGFTDSRNVLLQLDEIHERSDYCHKGGKLFGSSFMKTDSADPDSLSTPDPAKTVSAFQVTSLLTKWSEIVILLPCCDAKSSE